MALKTTWILAAAAVLSATPAHAQGGDGSSFHFRLWASTDSGSYNDEAYNQSKDASSRQSHTNLQGTDLEVAGVYGGWVTEIMDRSLTVKNADWWKMRSELALSEGYAFDAFPWVQPYLGLFQMQETDDKSLADAPVAFIKTNRVLAFGLRTSFFPLDLGDHGPLFQGRLAYLTSLEKSRNFGTETAGGVGYAWFTNGVKLTLAWNREFSFFNATQKDPDNTGMILHVRDTYRLDKIGLYIEY